MVGVALFHLGQGGKALLCGTQGGGKLGGVDFGFGNLFTHFGHLDLLYPKASMTPAAALQIAIDGETYEYSEMYPGFRATAEREGNGAAVAEMDEQIAESQVHAAQFAATLRTAQKRFAALAKVEERHANHYRAQLAKVAA